jgi:hypothetical protein
MTCEPPGRDRELASLVELFKSGEVVDGDVVSAVARAGAFATHRRSRMAMLASTAIPRMRVESCSAQRDSSWR